MKTKSLMFVCFAAATALPASAQDLPVNGNLTVEGWSWFKGGIDVGNKPVLKASSSGDAIYSSKALFEKGAEFGTGNTLTL